MTLHQVEYGISSACCIIKKVMRIIVVGTVDDASQHRCFGQIQLACMLAVIILRSLLDAADIAGSAEVHLVQIHLEDLLLVGLLLQLLG